MASSGGERSGLGQFVRKQTKYGTAAKLTTTNESYLKHYLSPGDTLQGIALKYGVTMENIKRVNKIWTNDSLHIKEYVLVPLVKSNPFEEAKLPPGLELNGETPGAPSSRSSTPEIVTQQELRGSFKKSKKTDSDSKSEPAPTKPDLSAKDLLSRFDTSIADLRDKVHNLEASSQFQEDLSNPLNHLPARRSSSRYMSRQKSHSWDNEYADPSSEPQLLIKDTSRSRKVQTSLEQLQKTQDEMFQL